MIKHIVLWRFNGKTAEERSAQAEEVKRRLQALADKVPEIRKLDVGLDFTRSPRSAELALCVELESRAALEPYQNHPDHVAAKEYIAAQTAQVWAADYEF